LVILSKILCLFAIVILLAACQQESHISFNEDIRPIFNQKCVGCHGGVKQAGGFGLVFRENALRETDRGKFAIVPGRPGQSELIRRVRHENQELRMPFEADPLSEAEIQLLERWIDQGAEWEEHWAYLAPERPNVPARDNAWDRNEIDAFVRTSLLKDDLAPAFSAQKRDLLRRVAFDLTGLPPSPTLASEFMGESIGYERLIDSLLNSIDYGEHWAAKWLELARYADSRGYERDRARSIWRYRDWVIRAYNNDLPYDEFITHQLAGDLLPEPTEDELVATGFHRNTMSNGEGGTENEEYRVAAVIDRVNTTWEVFQGTTMGCVQCHAHPYDPLTHEDFYTSYALFNNTADHDHVSEAPVLRTLYTKDEAKYKKLETWLRANEEEEAQSQVQAWRMMIKAREPMIRPYGFEANEGGVFTARADEDVLFMKSGNSFRLPTREMTGVAALHFSYRPMASATIEFRQGAVDGPVVGSVVSEGGWSIRTVRVPLAAISGPQDLYCTVRGAGDGKLIGVNAIGYEPQLPGEDKPGYAEVEAYISELLLAKDSITTPIMVETEGVSRRPNHLFDRGNWLVHGKEVSPGVPSLLAGEDIPKIGNRLDFARWLASPDQPLTARVAVNRIWGELFGNALVSTVEDLGSQGAQPSHQELLDYLALEFSGPMAWSQKALLRKIVLSATYRQSSVAAPELLARDPHNDLLARGPRKRLAAEQIRDQALALSGLLSKKMYGPGVMPPQPDGLWDAIPYSNMKWKTSEGEDRYRRAVYTYLRRSVVHPGMTTFDASSRQVCLSRRTITNTPLQALMTLNDPAYLEVARALAENVADVPEVEGKINALYEMLLLRPAAAEEVAVLRSLYKEALAVDPDEVVAMTVVANALLNIDELLTVG
jgi:hypothetical protein